MYVCLCVSLYDALPRLPYLAEHDHPREMRLGQHAGEDPTVRDVWCVWVQIRFRFKTIYPNNPSKHNQPTHASLY